ncbi:MAG: AI-2E family transporter [Clostridia bacterium]
MEEKKRPVKKWLYWFLFAVAVIAVYKTLDNITEISIWFGNLLGVLMPFIIGILIAYLLYTPCRKIENLFNKAKKNNFLRKKARTLSIVIVYLVVLLILLLFFKVIIPVVVDSVADLITNFQEYYNITMASIEKLPEDSILKSDFVIEIFNTLKQIDLKDIINMEKIAQYAKGAISAASKIFDIFVAIIVSIYILRQRDDIIGFLKKLGKALFKKDTYTNLEKYFNKTNAIFFNFLAGQLLDGFVVGIITSIGMSIIHVKYAVLLGFFIGILNLIPYFGAIVGVIIAAIITLLTGGLNQAITMLILVTILQQIDANIINPKITGKSVKISPLLVIFAVTVGGSYFGAWGMFLGVPVIAVIRMMIVDFIDYKNRLKEKEE